MAKAESVDINMSECANAELDRQDKALNEVYRKLTERIEPKLKPDLVKAQRAWLAYRDAQCDLEYAPEATGTDGRVIYSGCMLRMTYDRVGKLRQLLGAASFGGR